MLLQFLKKKTCFPNFKKYVSMCIIIWLSSYSITIKYKYLYWKIILFQNREIFEKKNCFSDSTPQATITFVFTTLYLLKQKWEASGNNVWTPCIYLYVQGAKNSVVPYLLSNFFVILEIKVLKRSQKCATQSTFWREILWCELKFGANFCFWMIVQNRFYF